MSAIETLLAKPMIQALGWALVHFIWQGLVIAALYALAKLFLRKRAANIRYAVACFALALMLVAPLVTLFITSRSFRGAESAAKNGDAELAIETLPPGAFGATTQTEPATNGESKGDSESTIQTQSISLKQWMSERFTTYLPWLIALWFAGVVFFSLRFAGGLLMARRLRRRKSSLAFDEWQGKISDLAKRLRLSRPVRLCESVLVEVPTVIGWLRPVILLPASTLTGLSYAQIEALLAHELAHIRRYDYLVNLMQAAIEALLFYHPAVWWVSREIREERENCCDDLAVAACGSVLVYARALAELEHLRITAPRLAVAATGGSLLGRIQRLIGRPARASHRFESGLAGVIALATILFIITSAHTPLLYKSSTAQASNSVASLPETQADLPFSKTVIDEGASQKPAQIDENAPSQNENDDGIESISPDAEPVIATEAEAINNHQQGTDSGNQQDFIGAMRSLGYANLSVDELVALRSNYVTPEFVREMNALLNQKLSVNQLVAFIVHNVTAGFIGELKAAGQESLTPNYLVAFRVHAITPEFISELKGMGYERLSANELTAFKVHGVTPEFISTVKELGYDRVSVNELTAMKVHGVTPAFIQAMRRYVGGNLSINHLTAFRVHGVSEAFITELQSLGYSGLSAEQLTGARVHGVTPAYVRAVQAFGFRPSIDQLMQMRIHGVTPEFVEAVKSRGFNDVTIAQLIELRRLNIIPGSRKK